MAARVILLNGPGSVGKSSVARALQACASGPLLHVSMDSFCEMLPDRAWDDADFFRFESRGSPAEPATEVLTGPKGAALLAAMRATVADLARRGLDVVVDDVWLDGEPAEYAALLAGHSVWRIGLTAPLDIVEAREMSRSDRMHGLSRAQFERVHGGVRYDLMIDVSLRSAQEAAQQIAALVGL
ncbi:hypothetical protein OU426_08855 [Frigidibacter sp. RF13]|uniref:phosphotransferase-like protein n=1 Tax=Frigidibacter sp. RF13 TaxID=2997340 RepID=UPI00226FD8D2|nr:hypothetical protein [Frigidibacter sp. RF13]MCY1126962.1 hypothetical protein [Frigidibacter sp. RF13]